MIGAVIVLGAVCIVLAAAVVLLVEHQVGERSRWADERRLYVDRAIAAHVGEIVALDSHARRHRGDRPDQQQDRPQAVGL